MLLIGQHISKNARDLFLQTFQHIFSWYIPSRSLRSASERRLMVPSQRGAKSLSRTFSFTAPVWWNELPTPIRNARSLTIFKRHLKTHLFCHHFTWLHLKKNIYIYPSLSFLTFGLFPLTSHCPAKIFTEQCLEICITSTSCVCLAYCIPKL